MSYYEINRSLRKVYDGENTSRSDIKPIKNGAKDDANDNANDEVNRYYLKLINEQFRSLQLDQSLRSNSIFDLIDYCESMYEKSSELVNSYEGLQCYIRGYLVFNYSINSFIMLHFGGFDKFIESSEHDFIIYLNVFAFYNTDEIIKSNSYSVSTILLRKWMLNYLVERDLLSFDVKELYDWLYQYIAYLKEKDALDYKNTTESEPYSANDIEFIDSYMEKKEKNRNGSIPKSKRNYDLSSDVWNDGKLEENSDGESFILSPDTESFHNFKDRFPSISLKQDQYSIISEQSDDGYIYPTNASKSSLSYSDYESHTISNYNNNDKPKGKSLYTSPPSDSPPPPPPPEHSSSVTPYPIEENKFPKLKETPYPVNGISTQKPLTVRSDSHLTYNGSNSDLSRNGVGYDRTPEVVPGSSIKTSRYERARVDPSNNGTFSRESTVSFNDASLAPTNVTYSGNNYQQPLQHFSPPHQSPYNHQYTRSSTTSTMLSQPHSQPQPQPPFHLPQKPPHSPGTSVVPLQSNKSLNSYVSRTMEERKIDFIRRNMNKGEYMKQYGICGLRNFGSSCYINSTIQLLFGLRHFKSVFMNHEFRHFIRNPKFIALYEQSRRSKDSELLSEAISGLLKVFEEHGSASIAPTKFLRITSLLKKDFNIPYEQQDAQEFLLFLLDRLHDELSSKNSSENTPSSLEDYVLKWNINISMKDKSEYLNWYEELIKHEGTSPIHDLFQGHIQNKLTCYKCNHESITYSPFTILSLPIPNTNSTTVNLADCLKYYTQDEVLSGDNAWNCPKCSKKENGHVLDNHPVFNNKKSGLLRFSKRSKSPSKEKSKTTITKNDSISVKKLTYIKLPQIMLIHLSRFSMYNLEHKLNTNIQYPLQLTFNNNDHQIVYKLSGIINHYGSLKSGHYTSMVNKATTKSYEDPIDTLNNPYWCLFDDDNVKVDLSSGDNVNPRHKELHSKDVYVLCYERI